jgi:hypothetical protein
MEIVCLVTVYLFISMNGIPCCSLSGVGRQEMNLSPEDEMFGAMTDVLETFEFGQKMDCSSFFDIFCS